MTNSSTPPQLRLDFICNTEIPTNSSNLAILHTEYSQHGLIISNQPSEIPNRVCPQNLHHMQSIHDSYSKSCFCCGSVHYFCPDTNHTSKQSSISNAIFSQGLLPQRQPSPHFSQQMQEKPTALNESENPPSIDSLHSQIDLKEATRNSDFSKAFFNLKREQEVLSGSTQLDENALVGGAMPQNLFETLSDYSLESDSSNSEGKDEQVRCMWAFCSAEFVTTDDLIPHLSRLHLGGREKDSKCKWGYCNEYLYGTDELLRHLRGVHLGIERVKLTCQWENCRTQYSSFDDLTSHLSEGHVGSGRSYYVCGWSHCQRGGRPFNQRQKVMRHLQAHTGDKPFMCMVCEKRFAQATVMSQHLRTHTGEKPFKCPVSNCGKGFSIAGSLTGHLRTHSGEKPFACKFQGCKRQFSNSSNLTKHVRTHTGERPFRCHNNPPCPKRFARPDQAARHMKVHTNPPPY